MAKKATTNTTKKGFLVQVRSRHETHDVLRDNIRMPFRSVIRLGSTTVLIDEHTKNGKRVELNPIEAIRISSDKHAMKESFTASDVNTAKWFTYTGTTFSEATKVEDGIVFKAVTNTLMRDEYFPIVAKTRFGSRGNGNYLLKTIEDFEAWKRGKRMTEYIFEVFHNYTREYRLHITENGVFYTNRKMLKSDTPEENKWFRNDSNCSWSLEESKEFDKPVNWNNIVKESVKALKAVGLDMGAVDVKVQGASSETKGKRKDPKFFIIEINSAPSFGTRTGQEYLKMIPVLLRNKAKQYPKVNINA